MNIASEQDLNRIKGLLHYLNDLFLTEGREIDAEVQLSDSNGESLGRLYFDTTAEAYVLQFPHE